MKKGILLSLSLLILSSTMSPMISAQEDSVNDTETPNEQVTSESSVESGESSSNVEESTLPEEGLRVLTHEEAVEYANNHPEQVASFQSVFESAVNNPTYGVSLSQAQYDAIPADGAYNVLVHHKMSIPTGGDPSTTIRFLFEVYPELANITETSQEESEEVSESEEASESEDRSDNEEETEAPDDLELLKDRLFEFGQGTYQVDHVFVLRPNEASNQSSKDYLLGITYDFTNLSEEGVSDFQSDWDNNVTIIQTVNDQDVQLEVEDNKADDAEESQVQVLLEANDSDSHTVYYKLDNVEDLAELSVNGEAFVLNIQNLLKLPPQSALYQTEDATQALIFDFKTLYAVSSQPVEMQDFNQTEVENLSSEAKRLYEQLVSENEVTEWTLYGLEVNYDLDEDESVQVTKDLEDDESEEEIEIAQVNSEDDWETMTYNGVEYHLVSVE